MEWLHNSFVSFRFPFRCPYTLRYDGCRHDNDETNDVSYNFHDLRSRLDKLFVGQWSWYILRRLGAELVPTFTLFILLTVDERKNQTNIWFELLPNL